MAVDYKQHGKGKIMHNKIKLLILVLSALLATACSKEEAKSGADAAMDTASQGAADAADAADDMMDEAGEMADDAMDMAGDAMDEAGEMAEDALDKADAAIDDMAKGE